MPDEAIKEAHVFVAVGSESGRPFAVAIIEGADGRSMLHLFKVDNASADLAAALALRHLGISADHSVAITVQTQVTKCCVAQFFREIDASFDRSGFPKGIGDA
jgi:hypothetical protein